MDQETDSVSSTHSRRDIIRKTAVAGTVAWSAPVVVGAVSSPAAASTPATDCVPCAPCGEHDSEYLIVGTKTGPGDDDWTFVPGTTAPTGCEPCGYSAPGTGLPDPLVTVTSGGFAVTATCPGGASGGEGESEGESGGGETGGSSEEGGENSGDGDGDGSSGGGIACVQGWSGELDGLCVACDDTQDCGEGVSISVDPATIDTIYITICCSGGGAGGEGETEGGGGD